MRIYKITHNESGKIYIGQTKKSIQVRLSCHAKGNRSYISRALNRHGIASFSVETIDEAITQEELDEKEKYWIRHYDSKAPQGYNCTDGGDGVPGYKHSEESRKRMSQSHAGISLPEETKRKIGLAHKGRRLTEEHKRKISVSHMGIGHTEETRKKLSVAGKGKQPRLGSHHSEETKAKLRTYRIPEERKQWLREINLGKHHSEATKEKMRGKRSPMSAKGRENIRIGWIKRRANEERKCA